MNIKKVFDAFSHDHIEYSKKEDPSPMDTIGQLVDKLSIVNNKMWFNQEIIYSIRRMSYEEFEQKWSGDLQKLHETIKRCADLNVQRTRLMDEIDQKLVNSFVTKVDTAQLQAKQHKTY